MEAPPIPSRAPKVGEGKLVRAKVEEFEAAAASAVLPSTESEVPDTPSGVRLPHLPPEESKKPSRPLAKPKPKAQSTLLQQVESKLAEPGVAEYIADVDISKLEEKSEEELQEILEIIEMIPLMKQIDECAAIVSSILSEKSVTSLPASLSNLYELGNQHGCNFELKLRIASVLASRKEGRPMLQLAHVALLHERDARKRV